MSRSNDKIEYGAGSVEYRVYWNNVDGEFSLDFYDYRLPESEQTDPDTAFDNLYRKAMEKYEYIKTVNLDDIIEQAGDDRIYKSGDFADEPQTGDLPSKEYVTENYYAASYDRCWENLYASDEVFDAYSSNSRLTAVGLWNSSDYVDLDGIEKLQNLYYVFVYCDYVLNAEKLSLLPHLKAFSTNDINLAAGLENLEYIYDSKADLYKESDNYFEPLYSCKNLKYLVIEDFISEAQKKEIEENMPQVTLFADTIEEYTDFVNNNDDNAETELAEGVNPTC
jgi:hypothetical protein